jgi:hypothetical protein
LAHPEDNSPAPDLSPASLLYRLVAGRTELSNGMRTCHLILRAHYNVYMLTRFIGFLLALSATAVQPDPRFDQVFWKTWGDGQAELASYDLVYMRYGHPRKGLAVSIFVTEPFSNSARVKADAGKHPDTDVFPVMKLNLVEDFQTGVYDYNEQTSSFLGLAPMAGRASGALAKVSFSSQEWCGHAYAQLLFEPGKLRFTSHSYFDGEADEQRDIAAPAAGVHEEQLPFWARGMAQPWIEPGKTVETPFLAALQTARHDHKPLAWTKAKLTRLSGTREITVPAGKFRVETFKAEIEKAPTRIYYVEQGGAKRIVKWENSSGEHAELVASDRMKYWELNKPGNEAMLKKLGLSPRPARTP